MPIKLSPSPTDFVGDPGVIPTTAGGPEAWVVLLGMVFLALIMLARQQRSKAAEARREEDRLRTLAGLGTMAVGFVHDINNQLMVLFGSLEQARSSGDLPPDVNGLLTQVDVAANSMGDLAGRMLRLARKDPLVSRTFALDTLLQRVMSNLDSLGNQGVELRLHAEDCAQNLMGDATLLESALTNLGKNGIEALDGDGLLEIRTFVRNEQLTIVVEDNGPGIDRELLDDLFVPFRTERSSHGGTGLGLYMAKVAIEAHGGSISVEAARPHGARFSVGLPLQTAPKSLHYS